MHRGQADESTEVAFFSSQEKIGMLIQEVVFVRSQAGADSLTGQCI